MMSETARPLSLGIGIVTRNRWNDLAETLRGIRAHGLDIRTCLVIDDGSDESCPVSLAGEFPEVRFVRDESSQGICHQRNRCVRLLEETLLLQLDDDSYPIRGDLRVAADFLQQQETCFALALNLAQNRPAPSVPTGTPPYEVQLFRGCAVLLHRERFLRLGGYRERFRGYAEEAELCARAFGRGLTTFCHPSIVIRHSLSPRNRDKRRQAKFGARNRLVMAWLHFPFPSVAWRMVTLIASCLCFDRHRCSRLHGFLLGFGEILLRARGDRTPMTRAQYQRWYQLPWAPHE